MLNFARKIDNAPFYQQADMVNQMNFKSRGGKQCLLWSILFLTLLRSLSDIREYFGGIEHIWFKKLMLGYVEY
jgi:hypothetical protein